MLIPKYLLVCWSHWNSIFGMSLNIIFDWILYIFNQNTNFNLICITKYEKFNNYQFNTHLYIRFYFLFRPHLMPMKISQQFSSDWPLFLQYFHTSFLDNCSLNDEANHTQKKLKRYQIDLSRRLLNPLATAYKQFHFLLKSLFRHNI